MTLEDATAARQHRLNAERAAAETLWDDAVREYEACLSIVSAGDAPDEDEAALLTALGSCYWNLSEARTSWRTLRRAIALCRDRGDGVGVARATVEILRIWGPPDRQRAMAEDALEALGDADPYLKARLLLRLRWFDEDNAEKFEQALAIADEHGFEDIQSARTETAAWDDLHAGRIEAGVEKLQRVHETFARLHAWEPAAGVLRGAEFSTLAHGDLDRGEQLARRCREYARSVHIVFTEHLALMDLAGVAFARGDFEHCHQLVDEAPHTTDFRGDLYRAWMAELRGDTREAFALLVDPERGGGASTAISQTHGAAAGVLYRAGNEDNAKQELSEWSEVSRQNESLADEAPALFECIAGVGDHDLVQAVYEAYARGTSRSPVPPRYATLQGRATAPAFGAMCVRLGRLDEAERVYREGLEWCERERCPIDAGLCLVGLVDVADRRGNRADEHSSRARTLFERHGAKLHLDRLAARQSP